MRRASLTIGAMVALMCAFGPVGYASAAASGKIQGQLVVAGRSDKGEVATFVFIVPSNAKQPISLSEAAKTAQQLDDPSGRFEFGGVDDGEYFVAVENELLSFSDKYESVVVAVGPRIATVAAIRVRVVGGVQDHQVMFRVTPESAANKFPSLTAPRAGDGGTLSAIGDGGHAHAAAETGETPGAKDYAGNEALIAGVVTLLMSSILGGLALLRLLAKHA